MKEPFRGSVAHAQQARGKRKIFLRKYAPPSRSENHLFSLYTFGRAKRAVLTAEKPCFRSGNKNAPFADTAPLLFVLYILDQIGRLAVQEGADYFKRSPRRHLPASYLLEHRFSHNLFFADASRVVACLFQSGQHVNFIYDWHLRKSPPFPLSLL